MLQKENEKLKIENNKLKIENNLLYQKIDFYKYDELTGLETRADFKLKINKKIENHSPFFYL